MTEMRNLLHNPRPGMPGASEFVSRSPSAEVSYTSGRIRVKALDTYAIATRTITLPAGDWVYSAYMGDYSGSDTCSTTEGRGVYVIANGGWLSHAPFAGIRKRYTTKFHLDAHTTVELRLSGPSTVGESIDYRSLLLASKDDYDHMISLTDSAGNPLNITWFDGDTYPR